MLNLVILARNKVKVAVLAVFCKVARAVDKLGIKRIAGILAERFGRFLRVVVIAEGKRGTPYADFALDSVLLNERISVKQENIGIFERNSDWQSVLVFERSADLVVKAVAGNLRRAVKIDKIHLRQLFAPVVENLVRHNLAGEHYGSERRRNLLFKSVEVFNNTQSRGCPDDGVNLPFVNAVNELAGEREEQLGNNVHTCAVAQG